jgi:hypothetical protein
LPSKGLPLNIGFFRGLFMAATTLQPKYGYHANSLDALASGTQVTTWASVGTLAVDMTASNDTVGGTNAVLTKSGTETFVNFIPKQFFAPTSPFSFTFRDGWNNPVGGFTFALNIRISSTSGTSGDQQRIFQIGDTNVSVPTNSILLLREDITSNMQFIVRSEGSLEMRASLPNGWVASTSATAFTTHIITFEHTATPTLRWYVNGILQNITNVLLSTIVGNRSYGFGGLGKSLNLTGAQHFRGDIKQFYVYDRALSANEVTQLNTFTTTTQPKYGYDAKSLDAQASGTQVSTWTSIGTVTVNLKASTDTLGGTNAVLTKSGTETFVSFTPKQFFEPASPFMFTLRDASNNPVGGMTFALNLRVSSTYDGASQRVFQLANTNTDESDSIFLFRPGTENDMQLRMFNGTTEVVQVSAANAWTASTSVFTTHIITYEHTSSPTVKWYINGVLQSTTGSVGTLNGNRSLAFGGLGKSSNPADPYFRGDMKRFLMYDRALAASEVPNLQTFLSS